MKVLYLLSQAFRHWISQETRYHHPRSREPHVRNHTDPLFLHDSNEHNWHKVGLPPTRYPLHIRNIVACNWRRAWDPSRSLTIVPCGTWMALVIPDKDRTWMCSPNYGEHRICCMTSLTDQIGYVRNWRKLIKRSSQPSMTIMNTSGFRWFFGLCILSHLVAWKGFSGAV